MRVLLERRQRDDCKCGWCYEVTVSCGRCREYIKTAHSADAIAEVFTDHECGAE